MAPHILSILESFLRGQAAQKLLLDHEEIHSEDEFFLAVEKEFVPTYLQ